MLWGTYVQNLTDICWVGRHQDPYQRSITLLVLMMIMDIADWGCCPWWQRFGLSTHALNIAMFKIWLKSFEFESTKKRTLSKINDISGVVSAGYDDDDGHSWLGLVSLMVNWVFSICSEEAMFEIWLKSVEFKSIKNPCKDQWHCWSWSWTWWGLMLFLTGAGVFDDGWIVLIWSEEVLF